MQEIAADIMHHLPENKKRKCQSLLGLLENHIETLKANASNAQDHIKTLKAYHRVLEEAHNSSLIQLAQYKALYATRPLLEIGLAEYMMQKRFPLDSTNTWLTQQVHKEFVFDADTELSDFAKKKIKFLNAHFGWSIREDDQSFQEYLWNLYGKFSERHHGLPRSEEGSGFIISGDSTYMAAAAVVFACALRHARCLQNISIAIAPTEDKLCISCHGHIRYRK